MQTDFEATVVMLKQVFSAGPIRIGWSVQGGIIKNKRTSPSEEEKAELLATIGVQCSEGLFPLLKDTLGNISRRMKKGLADRAHLGGLVEQIAASQKVSEGWAIKFINRGKQFLLSNPFWADDLRPICHIVEHCPEIISDEDLERARNVVMEVAEYTASGERDLDAEQLREEAEALQSASRTVDVDISQKVHQIREHADALEQERETNPEKIEYSKSESSERDESSDEEIASLFATIDVKPQ